jgi:hypothetical protein
MKTILVGLIIVGLFNLFLGGAGLALLSLNRAESVSLLMNYAIMVKPELKNIPGDSAFTDLSGLTQEQVRNIEIAKALKITAGTSETTFSPLEITPLWQWAILYGKTVQAINTH